MRLSGENTIWKFCTLHLDELKHHQKKPQKIKKKYKGNGRNGHLILCWWNVKYS